MPFESLPPQLNRRLQTLFLRCGPFSTHQTLEAYFVDARIATWKDHLPQANDSSSRIRALIDYLRTQDNAQDENALILFVKVLAEGTPAGTADRRDLEQLGADLQHLAQGGRPGGGRRDSILAALAAERGLSDVPTGDSPGRFAIDRTMITDYDLEDLTSEFRRALKYEGAFSFTVAGDQQYLENYILERMLKELRDKTRRPVRPPLSIQLHWTDVSEALLDLEEELCFHHRSSSLKAIVQDCGRSDLILVIWNYDIPPEKMAAIALPFWQKIQQEIVPLLSSRCLIVLWVNVGTDKTPLALGGGVTLQPPQHFDTKELLPYLRGCLQQHQLEEKLITWYLARLQRRGGHLIATYREMLQIVKELQGGITG